MIPERIQIEEEATGGEVPWPSLTNPLYNLPGSRVGTPSLLPAASPTALSCYGEPESSGDIAKGGTAGWPDANGAACPRLRFSAALAVGEGVVKQGKRMFPDMTWSRKVATSWPAVVGILANWEEAPTDGSTFSSEPCLT